jgi:hypothetical protein
MGAGDVRRKTRDAPPASHAGSAGRPTDAGDRRRNAHRPEERQHLTHTVEAEARTEAILTAQLITNQFQAGTVGSARSLCEYAESVDSTHHQVQRYSWARGRLAVDPVRPRQCRSEGVQLFELPLEIIFTPLGPASGVQAVPHHQQRCVRS